MSEDKTTVMDKTDAGRSGWSYIRPRTAFLSRDLVLEMAVRLSFEVRGNIIEFGVYNGGSTRVIRRVASECEKRYPATARKTIFACDSFEGLREKFENAEVGTFKIEPPVIAGVEIVKGYFEDSLTDALRTRVGRVAFASLDADLFSSTICALNWLTPLVGTGTLLLFDEFLGEKESEKRAFEQWSAENAIQTVTIAEFGREPSGWGDRLDRRTLVQVVGRDEIVRQKRVPVLRERIGRVLDRHPSLGRAIKRVLGK